MYKKQLTAQKILCLTALIISVAVFIYSLGIMTDLYDALYSTMRNPNDHLKTDVSGSIVYYNMQSFNSAFLKAAIVLILLAVFLFVMNTHVRRKYYIGNYVAVGLYSVAAVGIAIWSHIQIEIYKAQWMMVDFEALAEHASTWDTTYTDSNFWFDIHYATSGLLILISAALIANCFWKRSLMKAEQNLIGKGEENAA